MKKTWIKRTSCLLLTAALLTGCGLSPKLQDPYDYAARAGLYDTSQLTSETADAFAADLCVVEDESLYPSDAVDSEAAALFDLDGHSVLYSKNAFERLYPASTTKVMTLLLAVKYGNLTDEVTVTEDAVITESGATLCGIKPGDKITMEQLLYGLMLPSGNDAGAAIAVHMADSIEAFSGMMNEEAKRLGATGSHFVNPHGLTDEQHYTTAYDLYLIFNEGLQYPLFCQVVGTASYTANYTDSTGAPVTKTWTNSNAYLSGKAAAPQGVKVLGGKTGTTKDAGSCLILASEGNGGREYISVVLKADGRDRLYKNMTNIINKIVE